MTEAPRCGVQILHNSSEASTAVWASRQRSRASHPQATSISTFPW